jgi:hypothetical protein
MSKVYEGELPSNISTSSVECRVRSAPRSGKAWIPHAALVMLTALACMFFAIHGIYAARQPSGSDFTIFYRAGCAAAEGLDPGAVSGFLYLPFFAACMAPLTILSLSAAIVVWQIASLAAVAWIVARLVGLVRAERLASPRWLYWAPGLAVLRLVDSNLGYGQVNLLVLAIVVAGARAWTKERPWQAGAWFGLATALKIVPGFLPIVFLVRRSWSACLAWIASTLVCVLVVPMTFESFDANLAQIHSWWRTEVRPFVEGGYQLSDRRSHLPGQSLTPVLYDLLTSTFSISPTVPGQKERFLDLDPATAEWILRGLKLGWFAVAVASLRRSRSHGLPGAKLRELSIAMCSALALAPLVHKAHMVWLIVPYALLLSGSPPHLGGTARTIRIALIALSIACIGLSTPAIVGDLIANSFLAHKVLFLGLLSVFAALLVEVWAPAVGGVESDAETATAGAFGSNVQACSVP